MRALEKTMAMHFEYDRDKAEQVALWLLNRHGGKLDRIKLIKLIFIADRAHLAKYGRPVVGGRYAAMPHGPVASEFYNDIKEENFEHIGGQGYSVIAAGMADEDYLSETDVEVLTLVDRQYGSWDTFRLRDFTHKRAWEKNYPGGGSSRTLPYEDFFEDLPHEARKILPVIEESQEAERVLG